MSTKSSQEIVTAIKDLTDQHGEPSLIVVDTMARSFGSGDENSQKDMGAFVSNADSLKASFPVIHQSYSFKINL